MALQAVPAQRSDFSAGVQLVEVYATVTDATGSPVTGLQQADFEIQENSQVQAVSAFASGEFPLTVALGVDRSWSMAGEPLRLAKDASLAFLRQLTPLDRSMVVAISSSFEIVAPLSNNHDEQMRAVAALDPWSTTALYDAVIATLDRLDAEPGRTALIVFSDGADRSSASPPRRLIERARRGRALVYPIMVGASRVPIADELAAVTGGRSFLLRDARGFGETFDVIARELKYQYLIGYVPSIPARPGAHEWRSIRARVKGRDDLRVRARDGYTTE